MQLTRTIMILSALLPASVYCAPTRNPGPSTSTAHPSASGVQIHKCAGGEGGKAGYIVALKKGVKVEGSAAMKLVPPGVKVTQLQIVNGFHAHLAKDTLTKLSVLADIRIISENCRHKFAAMKTQTNAPWGLSRLTSTTTITGSATSLTHQYTYDENAGACADIYVVDSGVNLAHVDFGGRATHGKSFVDEAETAEEERVDPVGHGTHCAGIASGSTYGVAKAAHVISVKVPEIPYTDLLLEALRWIEDAVQTRGKPSVVSYSLGDEDDMVLDFAVESLVDSGVHFVTAAGNVDENGVRQDVATLSPARLTDVITVGATDINDHVAWFSNVGPLVDVFAPGADITSTWIHSKTATHVDSGTSMAAPHVAGMVATMLCHGPNRNISPAAMKQLIIQNALKDVIQDIPAGTPNRLAHLPGSTVQQGQPSGAQQPLARPPTPGSARPATPPPHASPRPRTPPKGH